MPFRAKCVTTIRPDRIIPDNEVHIGGFYKVIDENVITDASPDKWISLISDSGIEIQRPACMFYIFKE